jgi:hypothetical protein
MKVGGQELFTEDIIERVRAMVTGVEGITRGSLARMVCEWLNWRHRGGRLKETNCRIALLKLEKRGVIELPEARTANFSPRQTDVEQIEWPTVAAELSELGEVELVLVNGRDKALSRTWRRMMQEHHPLGDGPLCGAQLRYLLRGSAGWLGGLSFSAAAWRLQARDEWIGWDDQARSGGLAKIVGNSRFLILPNVEVPNLASHVLGMALRRLAVDWRSRYDEEPVLVETFVDPSHNQGTCYRASNWTELGLTKGRGRQDRNSEFKLEPKQIFVYPLRADWQMILCEGRTPLPVPTVPAARPRVLDWAAEEFGACELGDMRLTERLQTMARDFYAQPTANLPQSCGSRAKTKAAYRFLDHEETSMEKLLQPHYLSTESRIRREPVALAVQDTSSVNYTGLKETEGLGPIGTTVDGAQGLILHSTLTFNVTGTPLGLINAQCWRRDPAEFGKNRSKLNIEEKESIKWLKSYRAAADLQTRCPDTMIVSVGDREADIYELFCEAMVEHAKGPKLLVRAAKDRRVKGEHTHLWETLEQEPLAGEQVLQVPRSGNKKRQTRQAHLEIRYAPVTLHAPQGKKDKDNKKLPEITVWAVLAQEKHSAVAGEALEWMLLTTLPVENLEQAKEKLVWYTKRWGIEVFHRIIKSGCRIEDRQLCNADRLESCLAIDMVVAWRIHHMTQLAREAPNASCEECFSEDEWKAIEVYATNNTNVPVQPPTLRDTIRRVANLGGFLGRKCDGEPGTQTMWRGLQRLSDIAAMYSKIIGSMKHLGVPQVRVSRERDYG